MRTFAMTLAGLTMALGAAGCTTYHPYDTRLERVPVAAAGDPETRNAPQRIKPLPPNAGLYDRELPNKK